MSHLELQFHACDSLARLGLHQFVYVRGEGSRRDLRVAACDSLQKRVMDEDVLVLGLDHVVALGAQARHMPIDVHRLLVFDPLEHCVNHDECSGTAHASTGEGFMCEHGNIVELQYSDIFAMSVDSPTCRTFCS